MSQDRSPSPLDARAPLERQSFWALPPTCTLCHAVSSATPSYVLLQGAPLHPPRLSYLQENVVAGVPLLPEPVHLEVLGAAVASLLGAWSACQLTHVAVIGTVPLQGGGRAAETVTCAVDLLRGRTSVSSGRTRVVDAQLQRQVLVSAGGAALRGEGRPPPAPCGGALLLGDVGPSVAAVADVVDGDVGAGSGGQLVGAASLCCCLQLGTALQPGTSLTVMVRE